MYRFLIIPIILLLPSCGLIGDKKKFKDSETYKNLLKIQEETEKKLDSIKLREMDVLDDSVINDLRTRTDSLKRLNDSLKKAIEFKIRNSKK